jgi:hypothetical protein
MPDDPFALLSLPPRPGLTDEEVRSAWRRVAAATHPDRPDGGDPARFGAAAAAYVLLRTSYERGEALAELGASPVRPWIRRTGARGAHRVSAHRVSTSRVRAARDWLSRVRAAWPERPRAVRPASLPPGPAGAAEFGLGRGLTLRVACAAVVATATVAAVGLTPATIGLLAGALTVSCWALWRRAGWGR